MRGWLYGVVAMVALGAASVAVAEESAYNDAIGVRIQRLVDGHDFAALQALEDDYRRTMSRSPSGTLNLWSFHRWMKVSLHKLNDCSGCVDNSEVFVRQWLSARPRDTAPQMLLAEVFIDQAFDLRGDGPGDAVAPDVARRVDALNDRAVRHLLAVRSWASSDPQWYAAMVHLALLHPKSPGWVEPYVREGLRRFPGYPPIYRAMITYLLPQWYGGWPELDRMARAAAADDVAVYADIYRGIGEVCGCSGGTLREYTAIDWPLMKRSMRAWADRYPSEWNMVTFMRLSCDANDYIESQYFVTRRIDVQVAAHQPVAGVTACGVPPGKFKPA